MSAPAVLGRVRALGLDSLVRNGMLMLLTASANLVAGFAFLLVASHNWPAHDVGISASVTSAILLTSTIADIGLGTTLVGELARQRSDRDWSRVLNTFLVFGGGVALAAGVAAAFVTRTAVPETRELIDSPAGVALVVGGVFLTTTGGFLGAATVAQRRADIGLALTVAFQALRIALLVAFAGQIAGPMGITASGVLAACVTVPFGLVAGVRLARRGHVRLQGIDLSVIRHARGTFGGHYLINLTGAVPVVVLPLLIVSRRSPADAAYYYAAAAVAGALCAIAGAVSSSLFVEGSHEVEALPRLLRRSALVIASLLAPAMLGSALLGRWILGQFGASYASHGSTLFLVLVVSTAPQAIVTVCVASLRVLGKLRQAAGLYTGTGVVATLGAWVLLPRYGIAGVGVAWLASQTAGAGIAAVAWRRSRLRGRFRGLEGVRGEGWVANVNSWKNRRDMKDS